MKRYILTISVIMIVLSACKKDANKTVSNKTTHVTFSVGYSQSTGGFNGAANITKSKFTSHTLAVDTTLAKYASVIYVGVYSSDGNQLFLTKQLSTDTVFGTANYNLPPGNYVVTFAAGQTGMTETGTTLSSTYISYGGNGLNQWQNTFFQKTNLTVGNSSINQNVTLSRLGAQLIVNIEDAVPANVKSIEVAMTDNGATEVEGGQVYAVGSETIGIPGNPFTDPGLMFAYTPNNGAVTTGTKNLQFAIAFLKTTAPYTVTIAAYNLLGGSGTNSPLASAPASTIAYTVIPNVTAQAGAQTILSGKLFGGNGLTNTGGFQMTVDPQWSTTTTTTISFQ